MNLISGLPCNITEDLCYWISCCCYQCFVQHTGHCVGKLALGHKGGRMYPEEKRQALFDGLNGVWMQVAAPADGSDGWVFNPAMKVNTLFSKEASSLHQSSCGHKPLSGIKRSCQEAFLESPPILQLPPLDLDVPSTSAANALLLVDCSSFTDDDFQNHVCIPIPHRNGDSMASIFFRTQVFKLPSVMQHHTAGVFKSNGKSVTLDQWLQAPPLCVTTHPFAM